MDLICYLHDGWKPRIRPASSRRDWMDASPESFAYRCLPLNIANAHGWEILSPCGFEAIWNGGSDAADVTIRADTGTAEHDAPVALFGQGTLTFHVAGLFRTPPGWNLWVGGSPNSGKDGIAPLGGVIETDWSPYTFTMNWRFTRANHWIRFEENEPFCHLFPVERQTVEAIAPQFRPLDEAPELKAQFDQWSASRDAFHVQMRENPPSRPADKWQKLYYRGVDPSGASAIADHQSKLSIRSFAQDGGATPNIAMPVGCPASVAAADPTLAKRDWLMATRERLRALSPASLALPTYTNIAREDFLNRHYAAHRPALLQGEIADWPALARWSREYLREKIGNRPVEFQGDRSANPRFERDKDTHRRTMPFGDYLDLISGDRPGNDAYITAYNSARNIDSLTPLDDDIGHIDKLMRPDVPFAKGMLWIGPGGTFTSLHHDLTNNLLIQVVGRKRVILVSPDATPQLYNDQYVFSRIGDLEGDLAEFPKAADVQRHVVEMQPGDALFIPIGWWHQVRAHDFSVSITNTNFIWPNDGFSGHPN